MALFETGVFVAYLFALVFFLLCCAFSMLYSHRVLAKVVQWMLNSLVLPSGTRVTFSGVYLAPIGQRIFFQDLTLISRGGVSFTCVDGHISFNLRGYALWNSGYTSLRPYMCHAGLVGTNVEVFYDSVWRNAVVLDSADLAASLDEQSPRSPLGAKPSSSSGEGKKYITVKLLGGDPRQKPSTARLLFRSFFREKRSRAYETAAGSTVVSTDGMTLPVAIAHVRLRMAPSKLKVHLNGLAVSVFHNKGKYDSEVERVLRSVLPEEVRRAREQQQQQQQQWGTASGGRGNAAVPPRPGTAANTEDTVPLSTEELEVLREIQVASSQRLQSVMRFIGSIDFKLRASHVDLGALDALHPFFLQFTFDRADVSYALTASRNPEQDPHRHVVEGSFTQVDLRWVPSDLHAYSSSKKTPQQQLHQPTSAVDITTSASHMDRLKQRAQMMFFGPSRRTGAGGSEDGPQDHHNTAEMLGGAEAALPPGATTMTSRGTESNASSFAGVGGEATASRRQAGLLPSGESPASIAQQYGVLIDGAQLGSMHIVYYWDAPGLHFTSTERGAVVPEELPRMGLDVELAVKKLSYGSWSNYSRAQLQAHFFPPLYDALVMSTLVLGKQRPYFGFETSVVFLEACTVHVPFKWRAPAPSPPFGIRDSGQLGHVDLTFDAGATYVFRPTQIHTNPDGQQTSVPGTAQGKPPTSRTNIPAATTPTSSPSFTLIGIAESYFRARNVTIRTSLHAYVPEGPSSLLLEATDLQLHYDVLSPQFWHLRSEWNAIVQLHHTTMFYQAEHTSLFTALLADWNHVPYMYSGEPYRSAPLHNRDTAVHRFAPSLGLLEVFFQHGLDIYLNANPENVVLPNSDIASTEHNTYSIVSCDSGTISYSLPSEVYLVAQENENCQPFEVVLHNVKLSSSVPTSHPLTDFCAHHALRVGELSLTGSYVICTPDMSLEQHASRMPTNSTPSMPTLLNQLTMRVNINTVEGSFGFPTVQHLLSSFENLFGSTTIAVQPDEVFRWLHSTGSIPPGNRAAALLQFLQLSEPRGNGVELHVMVSVRDIEAVFAVEPVSNAAPAADGGPSPRPHASTPAAHGIVVMAHEVEFSVASQVSYFEIALTATPIRLKLGSRTQRLYHRATKGGRGTSNAMTKSASHAALERQLSTPSSPRGGGGGGPYSDPLDYSRRSSLNETQFFFGDGSAVPPHYLHHAERSKGLHAPHRPAAGYQSSHHAGGGWCQMEDQYVCVGPITVARVSHVGPPPHRTKFHGVTEASIGSLSCHMSAETSMTLAAIVLGAVQQSKAEDPVRKEAMEFAKAAAERSHEAAQLALLDARGGGGGGSHTRTSSKSVSQDAMDRPYGVSPQLRPSGKPQGNMGHQYRCSIVFDIPDATQTAFERFLEDQHQSADDSVDLGVFCVAAGCDDVRLTMVFPDLGLCHVRLPEGVHMASSTLNDTNSNKRMSVKAPFVSAVLMVPKAATDLGAADAAGELVEVARVATCVCMRESISYPFDGQHGILGHFAQQVEFVKLCDYDHRVGLTLDSVFPRQNTTSAASAVRRNILAAQQQISAASYDTESVLQGQSSVASVVADDVIRTRRGARRLTAAELASIPVPNISTSAFTAAVERFDQRQNANGTPRSAELSAETDDDSDGELHSLDEHDAASPGKFTQGSKVFWTCGSEHAGGAGGDAAADATRTAMTLDDGLDNLTDLFSEPGSDANQSGSLEDAVAPPPVPASALRPVLEYYRCHRTFEVHRSHRTLSQYSHGAMLPQLRTTDGGQQRDFSNFHAHLPSIEFILHAEATAQTLSTTSVGSPSRHASSSGHKQLPKADAHEHSAPQETPFSFSEDFNEFDASRGDVDGPPLAWANRMVDNNRRSRDGSTTTHYHLETPLAVELFATIEAVRTGLRAGQVLERAWNGAISKVDGTLVRESAGVLGAAPERPQQGLDGKQQAKKKKQVSRSRKRNRLKQWSHTDQIVSICVPCIEAKWLSRAAVHDDVLVRPRDARTCTGVYTTTFAGRSLQLVAQKSAPSRRAALGRETIRYGLSVGVSTVAVMVQINYEPTIRVGSLHVDIPLVTYSKHADHIVVAYLTNATLRGKRDFVGEGQGTGCRASIESCATHSTRDVFHFINSLDLDLHLHPDRPNQQQASATPSPSLRHAPPKPLLHGTSLPGSSDDDEEVAERTSSHTTRRPSTSTKLFQSVLPRGVLWQLQGVITVQNVIRVELVDVVRSGACLMVQSDRPTVLQVVRPSANLRIVKPSRGQRDAAPPPQRVDILADLQQLRLDIYPTILHFGEAYRPTRGRASTQPSPGATSATTASSTSAASNLSSSSSPPVILYTVSVALRSLEVSILQNPTNFLQLTGKQWMAVARTQEEHTNCPTTMTAAFPPEEPRPTSVKEFRKSFSNRVLMILCKKAARQRQKFYQKTCPPHIASNVSLKSSSSLFGESLVVHYSADLADLLPSSQNNGAPPPQTPHRPNLVSPAPSVVPSTVKHRHSNRVIQFVLKDIAASAHKTAKAADWRCPAGGRQWSTFTSVKSLTLSLPYRPQTADVIHPQMQAWASEWYRSFKHFSKRSTLATLSSSPVPPPATTGNASSPPPLPSASYVLQLDVQSIILHVELPQESSARFHIPRIVGLVKSEGPRLLLKGLVKPSTLTTKAGAAGSSVIAFPALSCDHGKDSTKASTSLLLETFEAILDPHVTNHMLMAYEKVVTELVGIVAKSTARHTFQSTNDVSDEDEDPYHDDHQRAPLQRASTAPRSSGRRLDNHAVIRTFLLLSVRNIRVSLVTSMSEARVMFQQLDLSREVHHALCRSVVLGRCTGLRVALVDRDDYDQHMQDQQAHSFHPNTPLVLGGSGAAAAAGPQRRMPGGVGAPTPSVNFSASSNSTLNQRFGGYIWGMVELSVHFKAESKAAKKAPSTKGGQGSAGAAAAAGLHTSTDWSGDIEASALASGLGSAGRKYSIPQTVNASDGPASMGLNTATLIRSDIALSSRWGVEFIVHSPLVILRPGLPQHVTAALQEANHATAEMRAQAALDSQRLQTKLQASKAYKKIVALKQRWKMERKDSSETVVLPTATVTPPQATVVEGKKKRNNRHATPLASTVASPIEQPASHQVATVKRLIVSVQVRNFLVVVPCGEAAFRSVLEGRPDMFEQSRVEKGDKLVRQRFVPVMALKFHIRSTVVSWMREELDTTTSVPLYQGRDQQYSHFATPMYPNSATLGSRHGRPPSEASSGLFTPRLGSNSVISSNALPQAHQLTMQSEVSTKGTLKIEDLNLFFTDGSRLAPSHLQSKNFSFKTLVLGGVGTLTESDPVVLQKERYSSFDRARVAKITLPFSTQKELPPSIVLVAAESPPRRGRQIDPLQVLSGPAVANHGGSPALNNDGPVDVGASEHININLNISGPELHCTSRCTAMVSELMADFTPDAIPTTGATSSSDAPLHQHPSLFSVPPSAGPSALADTDSPTGMLLKATATPKIPVRRTVDARGILEPGKITLYTLQQQQRGGAMNKSFSRPTLGNRRGVSFTLSSSPPPPSATAGAAFDGHVNNQHRPSATEAMSVPLPSAVMTVLAERGGPSDLADSATIRIAVTAKRMEVDPAIAILWQEVQLWVKIHQQDSRDRAEKIYKHVLEFATNRVAKGREQQGTMDVETATVHSASSASKKRQGTGNNSSNGKGGVKNSAALNAIMDAGLPVPRAFATALWFLREQPNVAQSASGRSVVPPTSPVRGKNDSMGSVGNQSFFVDAAHTTPTTPGGGGTSGVAHTTNTKANKTTIHVNLTGLRLDLSTINTSESAMRMQTNSRVPSGGPHDAPVNMGGASGATNTFAALFTDHDGSLDLVIQHLSIPAASHHQPSLIMPAPNGSLPLATPPTVLVTIVARRLRFECQNKVEVKSLEMFLPHMIVSASMRTTPTDQLVASEIPTRTSAPPPPPPPPTQGSQRMLDESATGKQFQSKRGARSSLPPLTLPQQPPPPPHLVRTTPESAAAPAVQETDVISVTVHVPSAADDAQGHQNVGGVLGGFHPGPQMTLRAQHLNQIILVATHWQQKWNEAREETVRLFKSSAVRRLKKLTRSASSPPRRPARQQDGGHHSPLPKKPSPILFRRRAASSTMPPNQSVVNESMAPDAPSNHLNTLLRYPIAVRQWAVSVGRSTSWVDLGGGNKHEFSIGTLRSTGRHVVYHTMESLLDGSVLMQDSRIRSDGVLSGMNSIAKVSLRGFLILPADAADLEMNNAVKQFELSSKLTSTTTSNHDSTINSTTTSGRAASPRTDAALCPQSFDQMLRSTDGRTKRLIVSVEDVNVHFKERQIRDVALFSIDALRIDAKDAFDKAAVEESDQIPATAGATTTPTPQQASSQMSGLTPRPSGAVHVDPATAVPSFSTTHSSPSHAAALISVDLERCLMGITPQTSAAFLGLGGEVSSLASDQKAIAAANILLLSGGRGRTSSAVDDEFGLTSANNSSIRLLGSDGGSSTVNSVTFLPPPRAPTSSTPPLLSDALTPLTRRITSGQMSVTLKYSTIMIGSVIDARHLRGDGIAAGVDNVQDCIVLRVPDMEVAFAQVVLPPQAHVSDNEEPPTAERTSSWTTAAGFRHAIIGAWALARKWRPKQTTGNVSNSAATPSAASQKTDNTPTRELFGDNTSPASPQCLVGSDTDHGKHALQLAEKATVRKLLMLSIEQVELTRLHANERVVILGFRGKNVVELFAEQHLHLPTMSSLTASSLPSQIVTRSSGSGNGTVHVNVPYSILLRQTHPWTGSPRFEDFQAMLDVIRTFTHPPNVEALQDFAALRKTMEFTGDTRGGGTSGATHAGHLTGTAAPPHNTTSSTLHQQQKTVVAVDYVFQALDARRMKFAPQLRFGRDVSVSLETILSWLGTQEEMIPRRLFLSVCRPMETLMAAVEGCTSTEKMIAKFGIDAIEHGLASSE